MSSAPCTQDEAAEDHPERESHLSRREFVQSAGVIAAGAAAGMPKMVAAQRSRQSAGSVSQTAAISVTINGKQEQVSVDTRTTLLDLLREHLDLTGSKKGCDHGQCGACTVLLDGRRVNSCLTLAATADGSQVTTIEGLAQGDTLSPVQQAFLEHDGFQCGYCTPGQICSATAMIEEQRKGMLSQVSWEQGGGRPALSDDEIRERMSGNICRCGAYPNIVAAVRAVSASAPARQGGRA